MNPSAQADYLEAEVMTAAPQKLQLMLIDAAIRQARMAQEQWNKQQDEDAVESLIKAQQIVSELLCGIRREHDEELARKVAGVYLFVFRSLISAQMEQSQAKLAEALSVLEVERETWQGVCEQLGTKLATPNSGPSVNISTSTTSFSA